MGKRKAGGQQGMDHLTLNESMLVGHRQIDAGHAALVGLVNKCVDLVGNSVAAAELHTVLIELRDMFVRHIDEEETIMRDLGYPDMEVERNEHVDGMKRLNQLLDQCREGADLDELLREVSGLLLTVFIKSDMGFKSFLQSIDYQDEPRGDGEGAFVV
ncbi:hemerythrin domain-containing protein [Magnetovibrio sp.]|uniref:bacteriohemerythrin n=1 Tax=Magnetovibrio sp. TaxID=2024836 RepID=UPI002F93E2E5